MRAPSLKYPTQETEGSSSKQGSCQNPQAERKEKKKGFYLGLDLCLAQED